MVAAALGAGLSLACHHPLWPGTATAAIIVWAIAAARFGGLWLFVLPAALPLLNFSPWTGWLAFDEFDLLILGTLAGGLARLAWQPVDPHPFVGDGAAPRKRWPAASVLLLLVGVLGVVGMYRGIADAGGWAFDWFDGYAQPSNSLRVGKSLLFALALWPLLRHELQRAGPRAIQRLALGMQTGLALVGLAVLWERAAYPGLLNFSVRYRTTALFWEMHVGGAAIDAYLALATPFAAWALWSARTRLGWAAAAFLALLTGHACLTTFSRGVYLAATAPLVMLGLAWWWRRFGGSAGWPTLARATLVGGGATAVLSLAFATLGYPGLGLALTALLTLLLVRHWRGPLSRRRRFAAMMLTLALIAEAVIVIGGGTFMRARLLESERDFGTRLAHWASGVRLLHGPTEWLLGLGIGRLPASYARFVPHREFSGAHAIVQLGADRAALKLSGPATEEELGGLYALTQRVALRSGGAYRANLMVRADVATGLHLSVCEMHLLYPRECQHAFVRVLPSGGAWQQIALRLRGPMLSAGDWYAPRQGVFALTVLNAGGTVELASVALSAPDGSESLANRNFSAGLARWFPGAEYYFLPWHIDNLALELLIERGLLGLGAFVALLVGALWGVMRAAGSGSRFAPFVAASLVGALLVGLVSSLMDVPRIAFMMQFLALLSLLSMAESPDTQRGP